MNRKLDSYNQTPFYLNLIDFLADANLGSKAGHIENILHVLKPPYLDFIR